MILLIARLRDRARRISHQIFGSRLGHGCPVSNAVWEEQYSKGIWSVLEESPYQIQYEAVAGICLESNSRKSKILDVGCGEGWLLAHLMQCGFESPGYQGLDVSSVAVRKAISRYPHAHFSQADAEHYLPPESFDIIVFNESLYYFARPLKVINRYRRALNPGGIFVISMCDYQGNPAIWRKLDGYFPCTKRTEVMNSRQQRWEIAVYRPDNANSKGG